MAGAPASDDAAGLVPHREIAAELGVSRQYVRVIEDRLWSERADKRGAPFASFEAFVSHQLWWGLESSIDDLLNYCRSEPDVQALIRGEVAAVAKQGRPEKGSNTTFIDDDDRGATYVLRRLKRDNPTLAEQVVAGALSAHAAAVQAGFRKPTWTAPASLGRRRTDGSSSPRCRQSSSSGTMPDRPQPRLAMADTTPTTVADLDDDTLTMLEFIRHAGAAWGRTPIGRHQVGRMLEAMRAIDPELALATVRMIEGEARH